MSRPQRIQRKRTKGWRMPAGAIYVGRPSRWGNPHVIDPSSKPYNGPWNAERSVEWFRAYLDKDYERDVNGSLEPYLAPLRGHDLACWCPLDQPCHADVLLELANASGDEPVRPR